MHVLIGGTGKPGNAHLRVVSLRKVFKDMGTCERTQGVSADGKEKSTKD